MTRQYLLLLLMLAGFFACKKVDNELAEQDAMPSVNTIDMSFYVDGKSLVASYPKEVVVGDTITLAGRLKIDQGATMMLGKAEVTFIFTTQQGYKDYNSGAITLLDVVRFVVTPEMGGGPQPLVIRNGEYVRTAPDIIIRTIPDISSQTDTTLVVKSILNSTPAGFEERYQNSAGDLFEGYSVSSNGDVWLQTAIDIYRVKNGQMESFLKSGDVLTIDGKPVTVTSFNGVAVDKANTALYLSIDTKDPDNSIAGRYYLLMMDIATRQVTVLNNTWYRRRDASSAQLVEVSPAQFINSGNAMDIPIRATSLQVDSHGRILFVNVIGVFIGNTFKDINNLSRINEKGRLSTLLEGKANSDKLKYTRLFDVSDDGRYAWIAPSDGGLMKYDLELEELVAKIDAAQSLFNVSYEQNPEYKFSTLLKPFTAPGSGASYYAMPNGELLQANGASLAAIDVKAGALYAFAGLERGINNTNTHAVQSNTHGQARYVNFNGSKLLGGDMPGNLYLLRGGAKSGTTVILPQLYVLGKP